MKRLIFVLPILAGAVAGAIVALAIGSSNTTKTVTEVSAPAGGSQTAAASPSSSSSSSSSGSSTTSSSGGTGMSVNEIYRQDAPGVVDIKVASITSSSSSGSSGGLFGLGGNSGSGGGEQEQEDEGSGVVYNTNGDIITDEHVVAGSDAKVEVNFQNGVSAPATIVGEDASTDVAVIHVKEPASELHPIKFADSSTAQVGDSVVAIGSPFSLPETVTAGIVSAVGRTIEAPNGYSISSAIQTDASINPGNSGGPLLDAQGQVLGLNDQIETNSDDSDGVGFATPGDTDVQVANEMISGKKVEHAYVGICIQDATSGTGAEITPEAEFQAAEQAGGSSSCADVKSPVASGSPAAKAGLKPSDVITAVNGTAVTSNDAFIAILSKYAPGDTVTFTVKVPGSSATKQVKVTLANRPATSATSSGG